jgi:DNA-binding response OmpR family regulator
MEAPTKRILVVDDEAPIRLLLSEFILLLPGTAVDTACNVDEAEELLARHDYDCVISDFSMPGGRTGIDLLNMVRQDYPGLKVIIVTGSSSEGFKAQIMNASPDLFMEKPVNMHTFLSEVTALLGMVSAVSGR